MVIHGGEDFQLRCVELLKKVLEAHGYEDTGFERVGGERHSLTARFEYQGQMHDLEVYEDGPVMLEGERLFEVYMPEEFTSEEALLEGFAVRLDRYLSGGAWEGPEEEGWLGDWVRRLRRFFRRTHGTG